MLHFGLRVVEERDARGVTQEALAERLNLSWRQMQRVEAGVANIGLELIFSIAQALNVKAAALFEPPSIHTKRRPGRPLKRD